VHSPLKRLVAVILTGMAALAVIAVALIATGRAAVVVTHGISMKPAYHQGDLVIVTKQSHYRVGEIAAYHLPGQDTLVLHRIVAGDASGYLMKGDNNQSTDPTKPTAAQLVGTPALHLPGVGSWLQHLTNPLALGLIGFVLLAFGGTAVQTRKQRKRRGPVSRQLPQTRPLNAVATLSPQLRTAAAVTAALALVGVGLAAVAWSNPVNQTSTSATQKADGAVTFSYTAAVSKTAAYDGTTVHSPDPIFRKVTNTVDLAYTYKGEAASVTLAADLSAPNGWHSTIALAPRTGTDIKTNTGTVTLNLNALDARAQAAAAVIGVPASQVTVTIAAKVAASAGDTFIAKLPMTLTQSQLSLNTASKLTVSDTATVSHPVTIARTLKLAGATMTVLSVRTFAAILLLLAALGGGFLMLAARRSKPASEGAGIHRRYGQLLVAVEPILSTRGRPIVDVNEFATLARLAERYGLLVLHWTRSDIETFVVQDDAATYRYRTQPEMTGMAPADDAAAPSGAIPVPTRREARDKADSTE
jgi:signal peptidase I